MRPQHLSLQGSGGPRRLLLLAVCPPKPVVAFPCCLVEARTLHAALLGWSLHTLPSSAGFNFSVILPAKAHPTHSV